MEKQITFINARLIDPKVEIETAGTLTINGGLIDKKNDGNGINLVLLKKIGVPFLSKSNEPNKILKFLINFIDNFE